MSMVEEAIKEAKSIRNRVLETIDTFRPKFIIKEPLTKFTILGERSGIIDGQIGEGIIKNIRERIRKLRTTFRIGGSEVGEESTNIRSQPIGATPTITEEEKEKKVGIHY